MTSEKQRQGLSATTPFALRVAGARAGRARAEDEARKSYQKFFDLWKDADPDVPLLVQAREEFSKLLEAVS